ncbi:MAG: hypothetical protein HYR98_00240 [Nitrospirae bacterium]|nr:hypothetical protein [Nitrospirota bacterium]MBI3392837.1 hypothetical protein [Nitrospirota bacterium]
MRADRWTASLLLAVALILSACAAAPAGPISFKPAPDPTYGIVEGETAFKIIENVRVEVSHLSPAGLGPVLKRLTGSPADPFEGLLVKKTFAFFAVSIANGSKRSVTFNPAMAVLVSDMDLRAAPRDYPDFYSVLADHPESEKRLAQVKKAVYDVPVTVSPGGRKEGLLVFMVEMTEDRSLALSLPDVYIGHAAHAFRFAFERQETGPSTAER